MLSGLPKRPARVGLAERIKLRLSTPQQIGWEPPIHFALAFRMVHEVRRPQDFLSQIYFFIKTGRQTANSRTHIHLSKKAFTQTVVLTKRVGFQETDQPQVRASRAVLLCKGKRAHWTNLLIAIQL